MITVQITPDTPSHMLRAIRAACNELLGEAVELRLPTAAVESLAAQEQAALSRENGVFESAASDAVQAIEAAISAVSHAEDLDSAGHPWNAELHSSTKSKNADGTWKKRRGAAQAATEEKVEGAVARVAEIVNNAGMVHADAPPAPPLPPAAPTPPAEPIMPKIFALITSQIVTINQAVEAAQAEGYADLGANGLGGAPREAQEAVLRKLEGQ